MLSPLREGALALPIESVGGQLALGAAAIGLVGVLGWLLGKAAPSALSAALVFPAILMASLLGGWRSGGVAAVLGLVARSLQVRPSVDDRSALINFALFAAASAAVFGIGVYCRSLVDRLRRSRDALHEQSLHYRSLFETIPEGFAVCDAIRDSDGKLVDYTIVEINPALQRLLGVGPEVVGTRLTATPGNWSRWLQVCDRALRTGEMVTFERYNRQTNLWHEVHVSRLTESRMAQFFFDVTERKTNEARQAAQFDELNHRVKNNLAMVSGLLQLQARDASPRTREELLKAASRVQSIADVHEALSRGAEADHVDFGAYLQDLCASLRQSLAIEDRIALRVITEPQNLPLNAAISLGMVVNELVTNAVKYAYPDDVRGDIVVGFRRAGEQMVLEIRDHGRGLPDGAIATGGLGMRLVRSLLDQLGGEVRVQNVAGTNFEITLPAQPVMASS